jgi:TPR repeat protein
MPRSRIASGQEDDEERRSKHPRLATACVAWVETHPANALVCPANRAFLTELSAHAVYCLASATNVKRLQAMFNRRAPSHARALLWRAICTGIGLQQRRTSTCRSALCALLVARLLRFRGECGAGRPLHLAECIVSRRHFLGSHKNQAERCFEEGQRLYGQQRYRDSATSWGQAAMLNHGPSHAFLSSMLFEGRADVPKDCDRAFQMAAAGAVLGCAHSKGALGRCYVYGGRVASRLPAQFERDVAKGLALGRQSAAAGSCFGLFVVGRCFEAGWNLARDDAQALRLYSLAAAQGHAHAQNRLGSMFEEGRGVAQDDAEAVRLWSLAAAQGHSHAQFNLGSMLDDGRGVAQDHAEAARLYRLAAAQGLADAYTCLGHMLENGQGVAKDVSEAIRLYRLAAAMGDTLAISSLGRLGA